MQISHLAWRILYRLSRYRHIMVSVVPNSSTHKHVVLRWLSQWKMQHGFRSPWTGDEAGKGHNRPKLEQKFWMYRSQWLSLALTAPRVQMSQARGAEGELETYVVSQHMEKYDEEILGECVSILLFVLLRLYYDDFLSNAGHILRLAARTHSLLPDGPTMRCLRLQAKERLINFHISLTIGTLLLRHPFGVRQNLTNLSHALY